MHSFKQKLVMLEALLSLKQGFIRLHVCTIINACECFMFYPFERFKIMFLYFAVVVFVIYLTFTVKHGSSCTVTVKTTVQTRHTSKENNIKYRM